MEVVELSPASEVFCDVQSLAECSDATGRRSGLKKRHLVSPSQFKILYNVNNSSRRPLFISLSMHTKRDASPVMLALPAFSYLHAVRYAKPALSLDDQKNLLIARGLRINSDVLLQKLLRDYGFARLDAYCEAFVLSGTRHFRKSTSLSQVWQVIKLDEDLRNLLFPYLIRIELAIKAGLVEYLAQQGQAYGYMNSEIFHDQTLHVKLLAHASKTWLRSSDRQMLAFRKKYDETTMPPIWYLMQALPLGSVSKWISNLLT